MATSSLGIDFEALTDIGSNVITEVPKDQRDRFPYWQGVHLGRIVLLHADGQEGIIDNSVITSFTKHYEAANYIARGLISQNIIGLNSGPQFNEEEESHLAYLIGEENMDKLPSMVYALNMRYHGMELPSIIDGDRPAYAFAGPVTMDMIDPYSRSKLEQVFDY